jgi:hypothetical protein
MLLQLFSSFVGVTKQIQDLEIDIVSSEVIELPSETTDNPIESGSEVTDHIINRPTVLRMICQIGGSTLLNFTDRKLEGYEALKKLRDDKLPVTVVSGLETFSNMLINNITIDRNLQNATVLQFQIEFKQAKIVSSQRVDVSNNISATKEPKTKDRATSTQNKGKVQAKDDTATTNGATTTQQPTQKAKSILKGIFG